MTESLLFSELLDLVLKSTLLLILGATAAFLLRRKSAAVRHRVWVLTFLGLLFLPAVSLALPRYRIPILPESFAVSRTGVNQLTPATPSKNPDSLSEIEAPAPHTAIQPLPGSASIQRETSVSVEPVESAGSTPGIGMQLVTASWILVAIWGFGALVSLIPLIVGLFINRRLEQKGIPIEGGLRQQVARELASKLKISRSIRLVESQVDLIPLTWGIWRPIVLLPASSTEWDEDRIRCVLLHELAHIKRLDVFWQLLGRFATGMYWFNPLAWYGLRQLRLERELACDDSVLGLGETPDRYADQLLDLASTLREPKLSLGVAMGRQSGLETRIRSLLDGNRPHSPVTRRGAVLLLLMAVGILLATAPLKSTVIESETTEPENSLKAALTQGEQQDSQLAAQVKDLEVPVSAEDFSQSMLEKDQEADLILSINPACQKLLKEAGLVEIVRGEIAGVVVDFEANPIEGVEVDPDNWYPGDETITDKQGIFRIQDLDEDGDFTLQFTKQGLSPRMFTSRTGVPALIVVMGNQTYFEGTIVDVDGKAVSGATIRGFNGWPRVGGTLFRGLNLKTESDADGKYRLDVAPGKYEIQASVPGGVLRKSDVIIHPNQKVDLDLQLEPGIQFVANVVDSITGEPVEGFTLYRWQPPFLEGRSDAEGKIVFNDLIPGKMEFSCGGGEKQHNQGMSFYWHGPFGRWWLEKSHHEHQQFKIEKKALKWQGNFDNFEFDFQRGMEPVTIHVERGAAVSGRVTDPEGNPVEGATVAPALTGTGNSLTGDTRYSVQTDKDGKYSVVLPASNEARYNLIVHDGKYDEWRKWGNGVSEVFQTKPGEVKEGFDLQLTNPGIVRGKITTDGKAAANQQVRIHDFEKLENRYYIPSMKTAADGSFELKFVRPGKYYLQSMNVYGEVDDPRQGSRIIEVKAGEVLEGMDLQVDTAPQISPQGKVDAEVGEKTDDQVVALNDSFVIDGYCRDETDIPLRNVTVRLFYVDPPKDVMSLMKPPEEMKEIARTTTGEDGFFKFEKLDRWVDSRRQGFITAAALGRATDVNPCLLNGKQQLEYEMKLPPAAELTGRVTDESGQPVEDALVTYNPWINFPEDLLSSRSDRDGKYRIKNLAPYEPGPPSDAEGTFQSILPHHGFIVKHPEYSLARVLFDRIPGNVDVVLKKGVEIAGEVIDDETGKPAEGIEVCVQPVESQDLEAEKEGVRWSFGAAVTGPDGKYLIRPLPQGRYNIYVHRHPEDRTSTAIDSFMAIRGGVNQAPKIRLIKGVVVSGKLIEYQSEEPMRLGKDEVVTVGVYGPSRPRTGASIESFPVREDGTFTARLPPGRNELYFSNIGPLFDAETPTAGQHIKQVDLKEGESAEVTFRVVRRTPIAEK